MIGLYGYSYGLRGWLFFSQKTFACNSQKDCRIYAQKNQKSIIPYYDKLKKLLVLELVDTISKEELERVYQFFETKLNIENKQKNMVIIKKS